MYKFFQYLLAKGGFCDDAEYEITGNGVIHVKASDVLKSPEFRKQLEAVRCLKEVMSAQNEHHQKKK